MKGQIRKRIRLTKKTMLLILLAVLIPLTALMGVAIAANFEVQTNLTVVKDPKGNGLYTVTTENGVIKMRFQYIHNSSATLSYNTRFLYFTKDDSNDNPTGVECVTVDVGECAGDGLAEAGVSRYTSTEGNFAYEIFEISENRLREIIKALYGEDYLNNPKNLDNVSLYVSQGFVLKQRKTAQDEWSYDGTDKEKNTLAGIRGAAGWSDGTWNNFKYYFDCPLRLNVAKYRIEIQKEGSGDAGCNPTVAYENETVTIWARPDEGWKFDGWEVVSGPVSGFNSAKAETAFTMKKPENEEKIILKAKFVEKNIPVITKPPTPTPAITPGATPTPAPVTYTLTVAAGEGGTASITAGKREKYYGGETVTVVATPDSGNAFWEWTVSVENGSTLAGIDKTAKSITFTMPESNVSLTALFNLPPETNVDYEKRYIRYYTTDKGYSLSRIYALDSELSAENDWGYGYIADRSSAASTTINASIEASLDKYYTVGTDTAGNDWYFIPSGKKATYVHPKIYNGHNADTAAIKNITELVFPETIRYNGEDYTVTSIGGGTGMYRKETDYDPYPPSLSYSPTSGHFNWTWSSSLENRTERGKDSANLRFGVLGNGSITTSGYTYTNYTNGIHAYYNYQNDYHVYNTTLKRVVIPVCVTSIENYAFYNCQALEEIVGGTGVTKIGTSAFEGAWHLVPSLSVVQKDDYGNTVKQHYYYYNKAYAFGGFTVTMSEWQNSVRLSDYLALPSAGTSTPSFTSLKTLGDDAFQRRSNLDNVSLPSGVTSIGTSAFAGCGLDSITIPGKSTTIDMTADTLGTKGSDADPKTILYSVPESKALDYGIRFSDYYDIRAGYTVTYHNNLTPAETYSTRAEVRMVKKDMMQMVQVYENYSDRYIIYLDEDGHLWKKKADAESLPEPLAEGVVFRTLKGYEETGTNSCAVAYAENGKVYGIASDGTCTDLGIPAGSKGHLLGSMTLVDEEGYSYPGGYGWGYTSSETSYLYYLYNGKVYRKPVHIGTMGINFNGGGSSGSTVLFSSKAQQISPDNTTVTSFYVFSSSFSEKESSFYGYDSGYSSQTDSYSYSLPKAYLMTSSGNCMVGTRKVGANTGDASSGFDSTYYDNGPEVLTYSWTTLETSHPWSPETTNRFRQIFASNRQDVGSTSVYVSHPYSSQQLHESSYDNINVIDTNGDLIYIRDINASTPNYLDSGVFTTICAGKNFVSAEVRDGYVLLTDATGGTWKYEESPGTITAFNTATPIETLVVEYEFMATLYDCMFDGDGREFTGWALTPDGSGAEYQPGEELRITAATNIYAQWNTPDSITVKYHPNTPDGCEITGFMGSDVYPKGTSPITLSENAYKCSCGKHVFAGWTVKQSVTKDANKRAVVDYRDKGAVYALSAGEHTFYAQWDLVAAVPDAEKPTYTVKIADFPKETAKQLQNYTESIYTFDKSFGLSTISGYTRTVYFYLNTHASMSTKDTFAWEGGSAAGTLVKTATVNTADCKWELYDETNASDPRYIGTFPQGAVLSAGDIKDGFGVNVAYAGMILVFYPTNGENGSVTFPKAEGTGYHLAGYTKGIAYAPGAFTEIYREAVESGTLLPVTTATYTPQASSENLYAYYEPNQITLNFFDGPAEPDADGEVYPDSSLTILFDGTVPSVTPPVKEGATFAGYYDAINADGTLPSGATCYFDESGNYALSGKWTEDVAWKDLYAYWTSGESAHGQLYGFEIFRVFGTTAWEEIEAEKVCYTVGVQEGGSIWETLPLRTGVHPNYRNLGGLPQGGGFAFRVKCTGTFSGEDTVLTVIPVFCLVTADGYREVAVYYEEEGEAGSFLRKWEAEACAMRLYATTDSEWNDDISARIWNGSFTLPERLFVTEQTTDVLEYQKTYGLDLCEDFWIKEERLMLRFALQAENKNGEKQYYGMIPGEVADHIWKIEAEDSYREDKNGNCYEIHGGEVAVIYPGEYAGEEYKISGIY